MHSLYGTGIGIVPLVSPSRLGTTYRQTITTFQSGLFSSLPESHQFLSPPLLIVATSNHFVGIVECSIATITHHHSPRSRSYPHQASIPCLSRHIKSSSHTHTPLLPMSTLLGVVLEMWPIRRQSPTAQMQRAQPHVIPLCAMQGDQSTSQVVGAQGICTATQSKPYSPSTRS